MLNRELNGIEEINTRKFDLTKMYEHGMVRTIYSADYDAQTGSNHFPKHFEFRHFATRPPRNLMDSKSITNNGVVSYLATVIHGDRISQATVNQNVGPLLPDNYNKSVHVLDCRPKTLGMIIDKCQYIATWPNLPSTNSAMFKQSASSAIAKQTRLIYADWFVRARIAVVTLVIFCATAWVVWRAVGKTTKTSKAQV